MRAAFIRVLGRLLVGSLLGLPHLLADTPAREQALVARQKAQAAIASAQHLIDAARAANRPDLVKRGETMLSENARKLAEADAILSQPVPPPNPADDPMRDPQFVRAAIDQAQRDMESATAAMDDAITSSLFLPEAQTRPAFEDACNRLERAQQARRELRTRLQDIEQPAMLADMRRLRQDPVLGAELDAALRRIREEEKTQLGALDSVDHATTTMRAELAKLKERGTYRDAAELLEKARMDPAVRAAIDRAHLIVMHDQSDILRDSMDKTARVVAELKQRLPADR